MSGKAAENNPVISKQAESAATRQHQADAGRGQTDPRSPVGSQAEVPQPGLPWVLYDGNCPMCSREIRHYRRVTGADGLAWIDVADPATPMPIDGIGREAAMARFHVRTADGQWLTAADGFAELWSHLRGYRHFAALARGLRLLPLLNRAYDVFARWRLARQCDSGQCGVAPASTASRKGDQSA
jgi:predicted DCC family thiol-disulfide oxidoreductase YuxK